MHMTMIKTDTYHIKDTFFIDIVSDDVTYTAWIYNEEYGIKDLMFGMPIGQQSYEEFIQIVSNNIDEYINYYVDDHFDFEERRKFYAENSNIQS